MKKVAYISLFAAIVLSAVVGCKGNADDEKLGTAAAPPSADAVPDTVKTNKNRPGNFGAASSGPDSAGTGTAAVKPAGM